MGQREAQDLINVEAQARETADVALSARIYELGEQVSDLASAVAALATLIIDAGARPEPAP